VRIAQGRLDDAAAWAREHQAADAGPLPYLAEFDALTHVRLLLAQHRAGHAGAAGTADPPDAALGILERALASAEAAGRDGSTVEALWLRALAHHARGEVEPGLDDLGRALAAGVPAGYRRLFLDEGAAAEALLRSAATRQGLPGAAEAGTLLDTLRRTRREASTPRDQPAGPAQLSVREVEVLRLLATDRTGPEISRQLFMSINTFRTHSKHIFTKLDVTTRRAAVARAGDLGLL
jgi:LuxR family maltose regulon positive regulatory protein